MKWQEYFKGKKVTVMGLGLLGRGSGDAAFIAEAGAREVVVTDLKSADMLASSVAALSHFENVTFVLGEHREKDFTDTDLVLVAAGVSSDSPYLIAARAAGVPLVQSAALFAKLSGIPIIGVTGTRGKSTVTMMIHHVLEFVTGEPVLLGGNIRGVSNLQLLKDVKEDSLCVMELDSWQLQGFGWAELSPQLAVFTNFMEDHLNYYEGVVERALAAEGETASEERIKEAALDLYFIDKANIFRYQEESGVLITTPEVFERAKTVPGITLGQEVVLADASVIPEDAMLAMPGAHNRLNAALAYETLKAMSLTDEEIFAGLASFPGVPGRLQLVLTTDNVRIYNDNNATTPTASAAALTALDVGNKNIVLITGGADKGLSVEPLLLAIKEHAKAVITIPGTGTDALLERLGLGGEVEVIATQNLTHALEEAKLLAAPADIILFSPAFASFGAYKNEYERNDEFLTLVARYE